MCAALALVVSANASLNIAIPDIARDLGATQTQLQWTIDAYALVFAGLLLPAGALGDRFGRKGILLIGLVIFGGAYTAAAFATSPDALIAARAIAGLGAAAIMPVTLSIITNEFPADERDKAVAVWAGVAGAGAILGLVISGVLLEIATWEWVFAVNAVWAAGALIVALRKIPTSKDPDDAPLDPIGAVLSAAGLAAIVFAIIEAPARGWTDLMPVSVLVAGIALLVAFVLHELRHPKPMLDPRLFKERLFSVGTLAITFQFFAMFGMLFVLLQYLQFVLGYSPLTAALGLIPMAMAVMAGSRRFAPPLARKHGAPRIISAGLAITASGFVTLAFLTPTSAYWHVLAGIMLLGMGMGLATAPATTAIVSSLPKAKQGVASAVNDTAREVGGALGIAVLGSVVTQIYANNIADAVQGLPAQAQAKAEDSLAFVLGAAPSFGERGQALIHSAQQSYVDGMSISMLVASAALALTSITVLARGRKAQSKQVSAQAGKA
jgi:EmrB/QacA subfamily drug resistance transporter